MEISTLEKLKPYYLLFNYMYFLILTTAPFSVSLNHESEGLHYLYGRKHYNHPFLYIQIQGRYNFKLFKRTWNRPHIFICN